MTYSGKKRNGGWRVGAPRASGTTDFADAARPALFPLAGPIPLPVDFVDASDFVSSHSDDVVSTFLEQQLL